MAGTHCSLWTLFLTALDDRIRDLANRNIEYCSNHTILGVYRAGHLA
jgi:hypothetical protein